LTLEGCFPKNGGTEIRRSEEELENRQKKQPWLQGNAIKRRKTGKKRKKNQGRRPNPKKPTIISVAKHTKGKENLKVL